MMKFINRSIGLASVIATVFGAVERTDANKYAELPDEVKDQIRAVVRMADSRSADALTITCREEHLAPLLHARDTVQQVFGVDVAQQSPTFNKLDVYCDEMASSGGLMPVDETMRVESAMRNIFMDLLTHNVFGPLNKLSGSAEYQKWLSIAAVTGDRIAKWVLGDEANSLELLNGKERLVLVSRMLPTSMVKNPSLRKVLIDHQTANDFVDPDLATTHGWEEARDETVRLLLEEGVDPVKLMDVRMARDKEAKIREWAAAGWEAARNALVNVLAQKRSVEANQEIERLARDGWARARSSVCEKYLCAGFFGEDGSYAELLKFAQEEGWREAQDIVARDYKHLFEDRDEAKRTLMRFARMGSVVAQEILIGFLGEDLRDGRIDLSGHTTMLERFAKEYRWMPAQRAICLEISETEDDPDEDVDERQAALQRLELLAEEGWLPAQQLLCNKARNRNAQSLFLRFLWKGYAMNPHRESIALQELAEESAADLYFMKELFHVVAQRSGKGRLLDI